jgi:purine-binding chemotaxis protein CheW
MMENQIVVFELGSEQFGVNISAVESIIKVQAITRVPHSPDFVEGVTNLRGRVLPVVDLRKRFDVTCKPVDENNRIIISCADGQAVGMIVDGVSEVLTISEAVVDPAPAITNGLNSSFITGIAKLDQRLIILLDLEQMLSSHEKLVLGNVGEVIQ